MHDVKQVGFLPPTQIRPAILGDVQPLGILLQNGKYGATFLVAGEKNDPIAVFLDGQHELQSFNRSTNDHWDGLAIEGLQIELNGASAVHLSEHSMVPGMMFRRDDQLTMAVIGDRPFRRTIEVSIQSGLPKASPDQQIGFLEWRAIVSVDEEQVPIWRSSLTRTDDEDKG